jgi:hypothetical protein
MSDIIKFYSDEPNPSGYTWTYVMSWSDDDLETIHDFIQWLFPTDERSRFNPDAPVLDANDIMAFKAPGFQERLDQAIERFRKFYKFGSNAPWWAMPFDHNLLRITRIIRCLSLLKGIDAAAAFKDEAKKTALTSNVPLHGSIAFWEKAVGSKTQS